MYVCVHLCVHTHTLVWAGGASGIKHRGAPGECAAADSHVDIFVKDLCWQEGVCERACVCLKMNTFKPQVRTVLVCLGQELPHEVWINTSLKQDGYRS